MSGIIGKNAISYTKQNSDSKLLTTGVKRIKFYHEAVGGDVSISFGTLILPTDILASGLTNPSSAEIIGLNLRFYRDNLEVFSSLNGRLMDGLTYQVSNNSLTFKNGYTAAANEIFEFIFTNNAKTGNNIVDARALTSSGTLLASTTDYNVGEAFKVNENPNKQIGAVTVFKDGLQQFRCIGNDLLNEGNYVEIHATGGFGTIIRFKTTSGIDQSIMVNGTSGLVAEKPTISMMQTIESIQGQVDLMVPDLAAVAGNPETNYQGAANNVDLKNYSQQQVANTNLVNKILNISVPTGINNYSARIANNGTATIVSQDYDTVASVSRTALGVVTITFKAGLFTVPPAAVVTQVQNSSDRGINIKTINAISVVVVTYNGSTGAIADRDFNIHISAQGADVKLPTKIINLI